MEENVSAPVNYVSYSFQCPMLVTLIEILDKYYSGHLVIKLECRIVITNVIPSSLINQLLLIVSLYK